MVRKRKRPPTWQQRFEFCLVSIGVAMFFILVVPIIFIPALWYFWFVVLPIIHAVETEPLYWLNWKDVKRKSGKNTAPVLDTLQEMSRPNRGFDCQFRPEDDVVRLEKFLRRKRPHSPRPLGFDDVIFYQFRRNGGGLRRTLSALVPDLPVWRPAIATA